MDIKVIPLSSLQNNPGQVLNDCCDSGHGIVVEMPDHRMVSIEPIEPGDGNDPLVDDLLASNQSFRKLVEKSKNSAKFQFPGSSG
jgi:hypothetical protein